MNAFRALRASFALLATATTGCALFSRPEPLITLQLQGATAASGLELAWPASMALESVDTTSVISSNRLIVIDGAKVMQFKGLRWVDTPAVMLTEQFKHWQARSEAGRPIQHFAFLKLALVDFSIHLNGDGDKTVLVSTNAELQCVANGPIQALGIFSSEQQLRKMDAQTIAVTFAYASETTGKKVFSAAKLALPECD